MNVALCHEIYPLVALSLEEARSSQTQLPLSELEKTVANHMASLGGKISRVPYHVCITSKDIPFSVTALDLPSPPIGILPSFDPEESRVEQEMRETIIEIFEERLPLVNLEQATVLCVNPLKIRVNEGNFYLNFLSRYRHLPHFDDAVVKVWTRNDYCFSTQTGLDGVKICPGISDEGSFVSCYASIAEIMNVSGDFFVSLLGCLENNKLLPVDRLNKQLEVLNSTIAEAFTQGCEKIRMDPEAQQKLSLIDTDRFSLGSLRAHMLKRMKKDLDDGVDEILGNVTKNTNETNFQYCNYSTRSRNLLELQR